MTMVVSKVYKVTFFLILFLAFLISIHIINIYPILKSEYSEQTYNYVRAKFCYECARGEKSGICPKINRDVDLAGYVEEVNATYPFATEYNKALPRVYGGLPLEEKRNLKVEEIGEDLILKNDYCYYRDWTNNADYLSGFVGRPNKIKFYYDLLLNPKYYFIDIFQTFCKFIDCRM
jgi:hypothetical protein